MAGTVTVSIEIELGWGAARYGNLDQISHERRRETSYLENLLAACETHDVPISFDVVGHLLLSSCDGHDTSPHEAGWWSCDPCSSVDDDPLFYAPDLIEMIVRSPVDHEICTHTFSHVECDRVSEAVIDWELDRVRDIHSSRGYPTPRSIVPPRHRPAPVDLLRSHGIRTERTTPKDGTPDPSKPELFFDLIRDTQPVRAPETVDGLRRTYSEHYPTLTTPILSQGRYEPHPAFRYIPRGLRRRRHRRLLEGALERSITAESYVHYWCHLYDLSNREQFPQIEAFIERIGTDQDVEIKTMDQLSG